MAKRIIVCSDGTWNTEEQRNPTNVVKMYQAIAPTAPDGMSQIVFYDAGVGTGKIGIWEKIKGGALGRGLDENIEDAYKFLVRNYEEGDEVFFFGFSRGAYTVRSTAGLIRKSGLLRRANIDRFSDAYKLYRNNLHPDEPEPKEFRAKHSQEIEAIKFIGVWDTVGALGIPSGLGHLFDLIRIFTKARYEFHDVELSRIVKHAYHAVAIDERRKAYAATLWANVQKEGQVIEQKWFAGVHTDVGGGASDSHLSDVAFMWMKEKAEACGLAFDETFISEFIHPNKMGILHNSRTGLFRLLPGEYRKIGSGEAANEEVHPDVLYRYENDATYRPQNLVDYLRRIGSGIPGRTR